MIEKKIEEETVAETKIEEKRVRPTVIRRRRQVPIIGPKLEVRSESAEVEADKAAEELEATIVEDKVEVKVKEVEKVAEEIDKKTVAVLAVKEDAPKVKEKVKKQDKQSTVEPVAPKKIIQEKKKGKAPLDSVKEVIVFPNDKTDKKKTLHKKKVFSKEQLYFAKERRRGRVSKLPKRELKKTEITVTKASKRVVKVADTISVVDLSQRLGVKASDIIKKLISLGVMATINQFIDVDAATLIANDFGFDVENVAVQEDVLVEGVINEEPENLKQRPPVVTVMGHVDHGKTLLLDTIRTTNVIGGEHGGITQHIGAYHVHLEKGDITFIDTPGHEAFTSMRARGVKVTDIVILVVAADDGVMPQTIEAINHAKAAEVPIIVAINKVDLPNADVGKVQTELTQYGLVPEEWGGENIFVEVSAKSGLHVKELLELVLLQSEVLELKANPSRLGRGVVLEAKLDKGRGVVATALVQDGSLKVGDVIVSGIYCGRIRAMLDAQGKRVEKAGPSIPVEVLGLSGVPAAGDLFSIVKDEAIAKQIANIRSQKRQEKELGKTAKVSLDDLYSRIKEGEMKELGVVIKGDVHGSVEAVKDVLSKLSTEAIKLNIIHGAVGGITEGDVMLASASSAIIIGFNVRPEPKVNSLAEKEGVDIRLYNIIYDVVEDVKKAMEGLLAPIIKETVLGRVEVRQLFKVSKVGTVAGSYVIDGKILRSAMVRLIREDAVIYQGKIASLKRLKESIKEVNTGFECGVAIEGYNDIKVGDIIEAYMIEEEAAKL